jgi:catechol O-methyltransferase
VALLRTTAGGAAVAQLALLRFLTPKALPWTFRRVYEFVADRLTGAPPRVEQVRRFVEEHAGENDPQDVLRTMDRFARERRFLMNVGPEKGPLMAELIGRLPASARVLELGAYCGYSAIMIADQLGPEGRLTSIEVDPDSVRASRANVAYAGYADKVEILEGSSSDVIQTLDGTFDLVFLDHWKDLYERDLRLIEERGLLRAGSTVVADNVGEMFGADEYLHYVRSCGRYESENRPAHVEYSNLPDAVEISVYQAPS